MSEPFVVKVQKSIATNIGYRTVLIYDCGHDISYEGRLTRKLDKEIPSLKEYFWAMVNENNKIELQGGPIKEDGEEMFEKYTYKLMNGGSYV